MTEQVFVYPSEEQAEYWRERAEEMDVSMSGFIQNMTEAGMKKFDASVEPDQSVAELRKQCDHLRERLREANERIEELEDRLAEQ